MPELTTQQVKFLSKYLKVVPKTGFLRSQKKHDKALDFNDLVKINFTNYEDKKKEADLVAADVKKAVDELKVMLGAVSERQGGDALKRFRVLLAKADEDVVGFIQSISAKHVEVMNAPKGKPIFGKGEEALQKIIVSLKKLKVELPTPPSLLNDGIAGALYSARAKVEPLRVFDKHPFMTVSLSEAALPDPAADKIREKNRVKHDDLCVNAYNAFCDLIDPVLNKESTLTADTAASQSEKLLSDLQTARLAPIAAMMDVIKANAKDKFEALEQGGNEVAKRENERSAKIEAELKKLESQHAKLVESLKKLKDAITSATGFKEKQAATKKYEDALKRSGSMQDYIDQLGNYDNDLALKADRIARAVAENLKGQAMVDDTTTYLEAAGDKVGKMEGDQADVLLLGIDNKPGEHANGMYDNLLEKFTTAVNRVTVDVKLFPGEVDLTDISKDQFKTLKAMIDAAKVIAESGKKVLDEAKAISSKKKSDRAKKADEAAVIFGKAKFMFDEANRIYTVFNNSNKFPLPAPPEKKLDDKERIAKILQTAAVELDRFWGIGGDADDAIRGMLARAGDAYETASKPGGSLVFMDTEKLIEDFQAALDAAQKALKATPVSLSEDDVKAKERAAKAHGLFVEALTELYTTKKLQESEIGDIPADHLLIVEKNGKKEYHQILTKGNGDEINKRDDKKIPRESINLLLEQATMLELLAQSDAPGMGAVIEQAVKDSFEALQGITKGGATFESIKKIIKNCDKLLASSTLVKWVPANLQATKVNFETFKGEYATKYLPAIGEGKATEFQTAIEKLVSDSDLVRVAYTDADKYMVQLEKDFFNKKGADKKNLEAKLAEIIKAGPNALLGEYSPKPGEKIAELIDGMKASLKELTDISKKASVDGPLKPRMKSARQTIETKSADGIKNGLNEAKKIRAEMEAELGKLDPSNGLQYLKDLAAFLKGQATAATETKAELTKMEDTKLEVKTKLGEASDILKTKNKKTFKSYKEYKTIYDSLKAQYDTAKKGFEKDEDAKSALSEYENILPNAKQLANDLGNLSVIWEPGQKAVNFGKFQSALETKILSVRNGAMAAAKKLVDSAAEDLPKGAPRSEELATLEEAVKAAAKTLELAGADAISKLVKISSGLQKEADDALKISDKKDRIKALSIIREKALAEVRRIQAQTEKHPALKVYRDNPFAKDVSWPAFAASLHELDVQVLTTLQPR